MWFWPLVCIASGIAVSVASVSIDRAFDGALVPRWLTGGPDAALEILGTVAGSMVSLTALVLTVVLVVIQLGMGQFSPRIVAEILQDKPSQFAIGIFVGTFAHAMLALSQVSTAEGKEFVPGVAILVAFALVIISIMVLVLYANHIGRKLRAASLIEAVGTQIRAKLDELYPDQLRLAEATPDVLTAPRPGVLVHIDADRLTCCNTLPKNDEGQWSVSSASSMRRSRTARSWGEIWRQRRLGIRRALGRPRAKIGFGTWPLPIERASAPSLPRLVPAPRRAPAQVSAVSAHGTI